MTVTPTPITKSNLYRLANVSWRRGEKLLRELNLQPCGTIGFAQVFPPETVGQLLAASAKAKTAKPQI